MPCFSHRPRSTRLARIGVAAWTGWAACVLSVPSVAADRAAAPASAASTTATPALSETAPATPPEPAVRKTSIDTDSTHIEELRVRGQVQSMDVRTKGHTLLPSHYQVLPTPGYQDLSAVGGHGAAGQSVWHSLSF